MNDKTSSKEEDAFCFVWIARSINKSLVTLTIAFEPARMSIRCDGSRLILDYLRKLVCLEMRIYSSLLIFRGRFLVMDFSEMYRR